MFLNHLNILRTGPGSNESSLILTLVYNPIPFLRKQKVTVSAFMNVRRKMFVKKRSIRRREKEIENHNQSNPAPPCLSTTGPTSSGAVTPFPKHENTVSTVSA